MDSLLMNQINLFDVLTPQSVVCPLIASNKNEAIERLVNHLPSSVTDDYPGLTKAVIEREGIRSCGMFDGMAIPHVNSAAKVKVPGIIMGVSEKELDWQAIDNKPVRVICLLVSPNAKTNIRLLSWIVKLLQERKFYNKIIQCGPPEDVCDYIKSVSQNIVIEY